MRTCIIARAHRKAQLSQAERRRKRVPLDSMPACRWGALVYRPIDRRVDSLLEQPRLPPLRRHPPARTKQHHQSTSHRPVEGLPAPGYIRIPRCAPSFISVLLCCFSAFYLGPLNRKKGRILGRPHANADMDMKMAKACKQQLPKHETS